MMTLYFRSYNQSITVTGQTYPHRLAIKKLGGVFVPGRKQWKVPFSQESLKNIESLCEASGGGALGVGALTEEQNQEAKSTVLNIRDAWQQETTKKPLNLPHKSSGITIAELYSKVEHVLSQSFSQVFWLVGEIESVAYRNTAVYITLVEKESRGTGLSVNALIWQDRLKELGKKYTKETIKELFHEGLKLCVLCRLNFYKGRGSLSLNIVDVNPSYTKGALALEKEKTIKKLKTLGLYHANKKRHLCRFPFRIGLITAEGSRAYSDFCHQLTQKSFCAEVFFVAATMQGAGSLVSLQKAFLLLEKQNCDMIVLTRGGGSASDLRCFDDFEVASLVAKATVPVLAAIGHHDDSCVCEEICFKHLKTPTAAAEFILRHFEQGAFYIEELSLKMTKMLEKISDFWVQRHQTYCLKLSDSVKTSCSQFELFMTEKDNKLNCQASKFLTQKEAESSQLKSKLETVWQQKFFLYQEQINLCVSKIKIVSSQGFSNLRLHLETLLSKLVSYDPRPWLNKGWTRLYTRDGSVIKSVGSIEPKDKVEAQLIDGNVSLEVTHLTKKRKLSYDPYGTK